MARMSISIPDQLKVEMDAIGSVNWSALAVEAFRRMVRKSRKVDVMNTYEVVERLRASYENHAESEEEDGHDLGVDWVAKQAEYGEILWIAETHDAAERLHAWRQIGILDSHLDRWDPEEFWEIVGADAYPSRAFIKGFVEGARESWENVKDQVRQ